MIERTVTPTRPRQAVARDLRRDVAAAAEGLEHAARFALPITSVQMIVVGLDQALYRQAQRETHLAAARNSLAHAEAEVDRALAGPDEATAEAAARVGSDLRRAAFHEAAALRLAA